MQIISEIAEPFCPLPYKKLYLNVRSNRQEIDNIIEKIQSFITNYNRTTNKSIGSVTGSAIASGIDSLTEIGGRVMVFSCNSCVQGFGHSKNLEESIQYNTEKERTLYVPQHDIFVKLADSIQDKRIAVDLFVFGARQFDLATFSPICTHTGGSIFYYNIDYNNVDDIRFKFDKLFYNLSRILSRPNYYDVKFMLRSTTNTFEVVDILGPFGRKLGNGFSLPSFDPDKAFSFNLRITANLKTDTKYSFQLVALYINNYNQRFLRVFNFSYYANNDLSKRLN